MPPLWQINLAIILAAVFWYTINILILHGMEHWIRLAVYIAWAVHLSRAIAAVIGRILDRVDP